MAYHHRLRSTKMKSLGTLPKTFICRTTLPEDCTQDTFFPTCSLNKELIKKKSISPNALLLTSALKRQTVASTLKFRAAYGTFKNNSCPEARKELVCRETQTGSTRTIGNCSTQPPITAENNDLCPVPSLRLHSSSSKAR